MRPFVIAAIIASLTVPAFAEEDPAKAEEYKAEEQKKKEADEIERAYKNVVNGTTREQPVPGEVYAKREPRLHAPPSTPKIPESIRESAPNPQS